jgi:hypothetical protein
MSINVKIASQSFLDANHIVNRATEYYGRVTSRDDKFLYLYFRNNDYAQQFTKIMKPYFSGAFVG